MEQHREDRPLDVEGVYFDMGELETVRRLELPGARVEIVVVAVAYEEIVVFRGSGSPSSVLGTLHKSPEGFFLLTREDPDRSLVAPGDRRAYLTLPDALAGLGWVLSHRPARSG